MKNMTTTLEKIEATFAEWNKRYKADPEGFSLDSFDPEDAKVLAGYFMSIHNEIFPE